MVITLETVRTGTDTPGDTGCLVWKVKVLFDETQLLHKPLIRNGLLFATYRGPDVAKALIPGLISPVRPPEWDACRMSQNARDCVGNKVVFSA
jgi:hypothetical protein